MNKKGGVSERIDWYTEGGDIDWFTEGGDIDWFTEGGDITEHLWIIRDQGRRRWHYLYDWNNTSISAFRYHSWLNTEGQFSCIALYRVTDWSRQFKLYSLADHFHRTPS